MNKIKLTGTVEVEPYFSYGVKEKFYRTSISSKRTSGVCDVLPCIVSGNFVDRFVKGARVSFCGEIRTRNYEENGKKKLDIYVFVKDFRDTENFDENDVEINAFVVTNPNFRETPLGKTITDLMLASNRFPDKSDYIPCIFWGRNASSSSYLSVGTRIDACGRLQSREYRKRLEDGTCETRVALELSIGTYGVISATEGDKE